MINNTHTYRLNQCKTSFTTLFVGTTLVLAMMAIVLTLHYSNTNIRNYITEQLEIKITFDSVKKTDQIKITQQLSKIKAIKKISKIKDQQININLSSTYIKSITDLEQVLNTIKETKGIQSIIYPQVITDYILKAFNSFKSITTYILCSTLIIGYLFLYLLMRILIYSKRYLIYNMRLVGATKRYVLKAFIHKNFWCSLSAGLFTSVCIGFSTLAITFVNPNFTAIININLIYMILIFIPILSILINSLNTWLLVNRAYKLNRQELNRI